MIDSWLIFNIKPWLQTARANTLNSTAWIILNSFKPISCFTCFTDHPWHCPSCPLSRVLQFSAFLIKHRVLCLVHRTTLIAFVTSSCKATWNLVLAIRFISKHTQMQNIPIPLCFSLQCSIHNILYKDHILFVFYSLYSFFYFLYYSIFSIF